MKLSEVKLINLLVIEDNAGDFVLIRDYLEDLKTPFLIDRARTFEEAAGILKGGKHSYDAILLDLTLPDLSGEELIERVLELENRAVTIVLTGHADMEFSVKSLGMGVMDYLLKDELTPNLLWKSILFSMERKSVSRSLKESEERYRDLFQKNPSPMLVWDVETRAIVDVNEEAQKKYGYSKEEFVRLAIDDIQQRGFDYFNIGKMNGERPLAPGAFRHVWRHRKKSGVIFFAEITDQKREYLGRSSSLMIVHDITEKIELQEKVLESVIRAEEQERNRISKELHDNIVQQLVACGMFAQNLKEKAGKDDELERKIDRLYHLLKDIANETRDLSHNLKSAEFDLHSLTDLTAQLSGQLSRDSGIRFTLKNYFDEEENLDFTLKTNLYRVLQELCSNVIKHSGASNVVITIENIGDNLYITLQDNGKGFEVEKEEQRGIGLKNIKSRIIRLGGNIEFIRLAESGMQVNIEVPMSISV